MEIISGTAAAGGSERLSSQNLRDLLGIKEEYHHNNLHQSTSSNGGGGRHNPSGLTLEAVLREKSAPPAGGDADEPLQRVQSNRTLLDIIREDQTPGLGGGRTDGRRSWRHLKDKIRLRRRGGGAAAWSSSVRIPASDVPLNNGQRRPSARFNSNINSAESTQSNISNELDTSSHRLEPASSLPRRRLISEDNHRVVVEEVEEHGGEDAVEAAEQPVRMSLMSLLAENDRQMGFEGSAYIMEEDQEGEEEDENIIDGGGAAVNGGEYNNCCVCMVRHKGAAFIPCGHTFCRLCSRELWVQRGNCPLCNNYILEILDIF